MNCHPVIRMLCLIFEWRNKGGIALRTGSRYVRTKHYEIVVLAAEHRSIEIYWRDRMPISHVIIRSLSLIPTAAAISIETTAL